MGREMVAVMVAVTEMMSLEMVEVVIVAGMWSVSMLRTWDRISSVMVLVTDWVTVFEGSLVPAASPRSCAETTAASLQRHSVRYF